MVMISDVPVCSMPNVTGEFYSLMRIPTDAQRNYNSCFVPAKHEHSSWVDVPH